MDPWEFALSAAEVLTAGLTGNDIRWLVARGVLTHAGEQLPRACGPRQFAPLPALSLTERSCYVMTEVGAAFFQETCAGEPPRTVPPTPPPLMLPRWDHLTRQLTLNGLLVKWFRTPAQCQERILAAFEEEGWPARIDDPLARTNGVDPHQRLHDTVRRLNGNQLAGHIRFSRDGTGQGVHWGTDTERPLRAPRAPL